MDHPDGLPMRPTVSPKPKPKPQHVLRTLGEGIATASSLENLENATETSDH